MSIQRHGIYNILTAALALVGSIFPYLASAEEIAFTLSNLRVRTTDTTAAIQWTTTLPASGQVEYGLTNRYTTIVGVQAERRSSHLVTLANLTPATTYHYRVISQTHNQEVTSFDQTFTTNLAVDRDAPEITDIVVPMQTPTAVTIQWRTDEPADSLVVFGKNTSFGSQRGDGARVIVHDLTITGLQPLTVYSFQVRSKDAAGNVGISSNFSFRTTSEASGTPRLELADIRPVAVNDAVITDTTAEISWRTTTVADGRVHWGKTNRLGRTVALPPPRDFFHATKLTGLQPETIYYFRVESRDVFGASQQSPVFSFATRGDFPLENAPVPGRVLGASTDQYPFPAAENVPRRLPEPAPSQPAQSGRILGVATSRYTPQTALLKAANTPDIYAIVNGQKHLISGPSSFVAYGYRWSDVRTVAPNVLASIPDARLVRTPGNDGIYHLYQRPQNLWLKLLLPSPTVFVSYPENSWGNVITINEIDLASYPEVRLIKTPNDPTIYQLEGTIKRRIDSDAVLDRLQLPRTHVADVNRIHLNFYPMGEPAP